MEGQSRCCQKYLLLQVWCALLTVFMVVMATLLASVRMKTGEVLVSTVKPDDLGPTAGPFEAPLKAAETPLSFIQLIKSQDGRSWEESPACPSCSLTLHNDSLTCGEDGFYFLFAQVTFQKHAGPARDKSVVLRRNGAPHMRERTLVEGRFPNTTEGSVWVGRVVHLRWGDTVRLHLVDQVLNDNTYWGAYRLR